MNRPTLRGSRPHRLRGPLAAGLLAGVLLMMPAPAPGTTAVTPPWIGAAPARAQVDVGILLPSFSDLPLSVQPGQQFPLIANVAPGAQCAGQISFRDVPPIDLDAKTADGGTCTWTVDVPPMARNGDALIGIDISRSGQGWALSGVVYVNPVGESR